GPRPIVLEVAHRPGQDAGRRDGVAGDRLLKSVAKHFRAAYRPEAPRESGQGLEVLDFVESMTVILMHEEQMEPGRIFMERGRLLGGKAGGDDLQAVGQVSLP